jgi:hypothetical protein
MIAQSASINAKYTLVSIAFMVGSLAIPGPALSLFGQSVGRVADPLVLSFFQSAGGWVCRHSVSPSKSGTRNNMRHVLFHSLHCFVEPSSSAGGMGASIQATTGPIWASG